MKNTFSNVFFPLLEFIKPTVSTVHVAPFAPYILFFPQGYDLVFKRDKHHPPIHALPLPPPYHVLEFAS